VEIPLAVEETDAHHRHPDIRGRLQDVSCEHAEAAAVQRERAMNAELRAEVRHRMVGGNRTHRGAADLLLDALGE
jgi:hypothetical protein